MGKITLNDIRIYAYHGCLEEEAVIGSDYLVSITLKADLMPAARSDSLENTVDYVAVYRVVKQEMAKRSKLLEHVALRIQEGLYREFTSVKKASVSVSKLNPPIGGDVASVTVKIDAKRK